MKIYTKTGDKGKTRLIGGCLVTKFDLRIEAYGSVDELNAILGLVSLEIKNQQQLQSLSNIIIRIQNELFNLGSMLACEDPKLLTQLPQIQESHVQQLESEIDLMTAELPELKNFILPGGTKSSAYFHQARTVCRRAERNTVKLFEQHPEAELGLIYLNRLSDFLFTAARFCNHKLNVPDQIWVKT